MPQLCPVVPFPQFIPSTHRFPPVSGAEKHWPPNMLFLTDRRCANGLNGVDFQLWYNKQHFSGGFPPNTWLLTETSERRFQKSVMGRQTHSCRLVDDTVCPHNMVWENWTENHYKTHKCITTSLSHPFRSNGWYLLNKSKLWFPPCINEVEDSYMLHGISYLYGGSGLGDSLISGHVRTWQVSRWRAAP